MSLYLDDGDVRLYCGDALEVLRQLPDESVDCCVSSPPYFGLRDYGTDQQLGLEASPKEYVERLVDVFREVKRVLANHGTAWLNLGDTYSTNRSQQIKPKDLIGIPWRVALALQEDGWWLRADIVWAKPGPMPESIRDRPTRAHEYIFLLTKRPTYYYDQDAIREPYKTSRPTRGFGDLRHNMGIPQEETLGNLPPEAPRGPDGRRVTHVEGRAGSIQHRSGERWPGLGRSIAQVRREAGEDGHDESEGMDVTHAGANARSVWEITSQPYPEAHFAVFPEELPRRCILAGCPEWVCSVCGKPSERIVESGELAGEARIQEGARPAADERGVSPTGLARTNGRTWRERREQGWSDCGHDAWRRGVVIDPFLGSGTTAKVARDHQRHAIGIELNEKYAELAAKRLQQLSLLT